MFGLRLQVGDDESREQLIKTHYMARVGELTTQLQISDSKAVHFHSEVKLRGTFRVMNQPLTGHRDVLTLTSPLFSRCLLQLLYDWKVQT